MLEDPRVPLLDVVLGLSEAVDLVAPALDGHHKRVAYIALAIGMEMGLSPQEQDEVVLAGLVHDVGALSLGERLRLLRFDVLDPHTHAEMGYRFLKGYEPLSSVAGLVRHHHVPWEGGQGSVFRGEEVSRNSHLLHLADRVAVLVKDRERVLSRAERIRALVAKRSGAVFVPELAEAFASLSVREHFWLDAAEPTKALSLDRGSTSASVELSPQELLSLGRFFCQLIDFRSAFTATHSHGVAATAEALARLHGLSERECRMMKIAGYFHDLGKLAVPPEILEKPARLTKDEFAVVKTHTYHTYRTLESIRGLDVINSWASFHHERLDGTGYPFHHKGDDISLGARIMAVADVLTAVTEDRPYRKGMTEDQAMAVLRRMSDDSALDSHVVTSLASHYDEVNSIRVSAQAIAAKEYEEFRRGIEEHGESWRKSAA